LLFKYGSYSMNYNIAFLFVVYNQFKDGEGLEIDALIKEKKKALKNDAICLKELQLKHKIYGA
jgi:hypothetical protein